MVTPPLPLTGPVNVKLLPAAVLTLTLLPSTTGTAMVWLPPLLVSGKLVPVRVSVRVLVLSPPERLMV